MFAFTIVIMASAFIGMLAQLGTASPTFDLASAAGTNASVDVPLTAPHLKAWGQFCNTMDCEDCGEWVDLQRDECLVENYRRAINLKTNGPPLFVAMVWTPGEQCECQSECTQYAGSGCYQLPNQTLASLTHSYRFVDFGDMGSPCKGKADQC